MTFLMLSNSPGGGGPQLVPSRVTTVWIEKTMAGDAPGQECPHDDVEIRTRMGTMRMSEDRVPSMNIESPYRGGVSSLPGATVKFPAAPVLLWQRPGDAFEVTGNVRPVVPAGGSPLAGVVDPAGPDGPAVAGCPRWPV